MRLSHLMGTVLLAGALGACAPMAENPGNSTSDGDRGSAKQTASAGSRTSLSKSVEPQAYFRDAAINARNDGDYQTAVFYWSKAYQASPDDIDIALNFARDLRYAGGVENAIQVLQRAAGNSNSPRIQEELGKALTAAGRISEAIVSLEKSATTDPSNWRVYSTLGIARDRIKDYEGARTAYDRALSLSPGNLAVLNNYALSRAMAGDLETADKMIAQAANSPGANMQIRQNRALILSMSGRFEEAQQIALADLPPAFAEQNMDLYKEMLAQPDRWKRLQ